MRIYKPVMLVILDGWGEWDTELGNPITSAKTPTIDMLDQHYPKILLEASGPVVGLPWGIFGNSEVGHQTIGSGQVEYQFLPKIDMAISSKMFYKNEVLQDTFNWVKEKNSKLHLIGLTSDGGVHSHINHLIALIEAAKDYGIKEVYIHAITDGRDTSPESGIEFISNILSATEKFQTGKLATIVGRFYAMDRNNNWDRTEKAVRAYTLGEGNNEVEPIAAIRKQYRNGVYDEYLEPIVLIDEKLNPIGKIEDDDAIICFNFRKDRSKQITKVFAVPDFNVLNIETPKNIKYTCFAEYEPNLPVGVLFYPEEITTRVGEIISKNFKKQLRIAETEKFAHVTYFFNCGIAKPFKNEERIFVPSKNVPSYADLPEMSAYEVTEKLVNAVKTKDFDFILVNYANPDMVGHTGNFSAGVKAIEVVDECLGRVIHETLKKRGCLLITADHGNVEEMINLQTGEKDTEHSTNPVPCWLVTPDNYQNQLIQDVKGTEVECMIADLAPTILELLGIEPPEEMVGQSLLDLLKKNI